MDYTGHGILQARILEWVAFPFSRGSSKPRDRTQPTVAFQMQERGRIQAEGMTRVCRELVVPGGRGSQCSSEKLSGEELADLGVSWGVCEGF